MIPTQLLDALTGAGVFASVSGAPTSLPIPGVASAAALVAALDPAFAGQVYELYLADGKPRPNAVHQLVSSDAYRVSGYPVAQVDRYVVSARADTSAALDTVVTAAFAAMEASSAGFEVADMSLEYEDDPKRYLCHLEIALALPASGGELPAAIVVPMGTKYQASEYSTCTVQAGTASYAVMILSVAADIQAVELAARSALRGLQTDPNSGPIEIDESVPEDLPGGLQLWRLLISQQLNEGEP